MEETVLYSFPTGKDGYIPNGNLVFDSAGNSMEQPCSAEAKARRCDPFYGSIAEQCSS